MNTQSAKIKYVDSAITNLTQNNVYEVISWGPSGSGLCALILDDNGALYVATNVQDPAKFVAVHI